MVDEETTYALETIAELAEIASESGRNISYVGALSRKGNSKYVILAQTPEEEADSFFKGLYIAPGMIEGVNVWGEISRDKLFLMTDDLTLMDFAKYAGVDSNNKLVFNGKYNPAISEISPAYSGVWHVGATRAEMKSMNPWQRDLVIPYREGKFTFRREADLWTPQ